DARCARVRRWSGGRTVIGRLNQRRLAGRQPVLSQPGDQLRVRFQIADARVVVGGRHALHEVAAARLFDHVGHRAAWPIAVDEAGGERELAHEDLRDTCYFTTIFRVTLVPSMTSW